MEDMSKTEDLVLETARFLDEHKGDNTVALYIGDASSFTDYFVITTVGSLGHLKGLFRQLKQFLSEKNIEQIHGQRKFAEDGWILIDCGFVVIHLMDEDLRSFYELERLWYKGRRIYPERS